MLIPLLLLSQSLFVKTPVGDIYQAINDLPPGSCILNGTEELVFEATNINQCNEILLAPGCYRAELRGGMGQKNENCADHATQDNIQTVSAVFSIPESTTIYALRGGDGNAGDANLYKSQIGTIGGGASGVDSILVVGDRVWRAIGGVGAICAVAIPTNINGTGAAGYGNGFGGNTSTSTLNTASHMYYGNGSSIYATGSGGGGAPNGTSNKTTYAFNNYGKLPNDIIILAGQDGTSNSGGNGGDVTSCTTVTCDETITIQGGTGGQNTYYSCGGHSAVSYGGGGGGASIKTTSASPFYYPIAGGNGGSGSTDTSSVSFLRIYKM